jgi:nucleoside-diphosphate-sugar epimerase
MRLLILGGTAFLGRAVARAALRDGHHVTGAARGASGAVPAGATFVRLDRTEADAYAAVAGEYDAVVDVSSRPSHVRAAVAALGDRVAHWVYVSSASAYRDNATPGQRAADAPTHEPAGPDADDPAADGYANYGPCKVACERAVMDGVGADRAFVCRAGLIVGPEDDSGRFTYWPVRVARGGEIVAPGTPDDPVQWIDVRDLANWLVRSAAQRRAGIFDGIGAPVGRGEFLDRIAVGVGTRDARFVWVDGDFLAAHDMRPWAGPRSLPLWLPLPEYAGFLSRDVRDSLAAGLTSRDLESTARDTLDWRRSTPDSGGLGGAGLTAAEEAELLAAWAAGSNPVQ